MRLLKSEHEAILFLKTNEILGKDGAAQSSSGLPPHPNSDTSTQTSESDSLKTKLLHELTVIALSWMDSREQIASLKYEVKTEYYPLWSVCAFQGQPAVWAAVFYKASLRFIIPSSIEIR